MKDNGLPADLLGEVTPQQVRSYALAKGWNRVPGVNGNVALFSHPKGNWEQLLVPMDVTYDDYDRRIGDVVGVLAEFESRLAADVLQDLLQPDADVMRYRMVSPVTKRGTVPFLDGIRLLEGAKKSLLASACSVVHPATHHPRMSRTEAQQLLAACELGQTERRSFGVAIACPLRAVEQQQGLLPGNEPFTRRVTRMLMTSVGRLVSAIEDDSVPQVYDLTSDQPVLSANLCDSLLQMQPPEDRSSLVISASWASTLPLADVGKCPAQISIKHEYFPIIEDVFKKLRPAAMPQASLFVGTVETLNGEPGNDGRMQGETTLSVLYEDDLVPARVDLDADDYQKAIDAHRVAGFVKFQGVLHLGHRVHRITDVSGFGNI